MYDIPVEIKMDKGIFPIRKRGDFRMVLDAFNALNDKELTEQERIYSSLIIFYDGIDDIVDFSKFDNLEEAVKKMFWFFNCGQEEIQNQRHNIKLVDWEQDELLICSAINKVAGTEIRFLDYLHWWTFMGYYMALGECTLATIVSIRDKIAKGKKLEKYEREFRRDNPNYFVWKADQEEADRLFEQMWNKGKK